MYEYTICNVADQEIFEKQCRALEKAIPKLEKTDRLQDVDGSFIQLYSLDDKKITVHNSKYLDEVYVTSEIELEQYFN